MYILTISEKILLLICGFGMLQGILLALLLYFHPRSDQRSNAYLALFIFFFSLVMTLPFTISTIGWQRSFFVQPLPLLTGPFLYLYIRSFRESITWRKAFPHFILFFLFFLPTYLNLSALGDRYPDAAAVPADALRHPSTILLNCFKLGHSVFYFLLARKTLTTYQRSVKQLFAGISGIDLKWGKALVNGYILIVCAAIVLFGLMIRFPEHFNILLLVTMAIATPYIYAVTYKGAVQRTIWQLNPAISKETVEQEMREVTAARPVKSPEKIAEVSAKIIALMEKQKLYQETDLTLQLLAEKLQAPCYQVSQAINEGMKKNFYEVVNGYRVEEAKRLLLQPDNKNFTILSVGYEAGFNSKTTFNTVFKKFTGLTPTEFRDRQRSLQVA